VSEEDEDLSVELSPNEYISEFSEDLVITFKFGMNILNEYSSRKKKKYVDNPGEYLYGLNIDFKEDRIKLNFKFKDFPESIDPDTKHKIMANSAIEALDYLAQNTLAVDALTNLESDTREWFDNKKEGQDMDNERVIKEDWGVEKTAGELNSLETKLRELEREINYHDCYIEENEKELENVKKVVEELIHISNLPSSTQTKLLDKLNMKVYSSFRQYLDQQDKKDGSA